MREASFKRLSGAAVADAAGVDRSEGSDSTISTGSKARGLGACA